MPRLNADPYYDTPEWRDLRQRVLLRDRHVCQYCGATGHQADHIIPRGRGGPDLLDNLVCACRDCNRTSGGLAFPSFGAKKAWIRKTRKVEGRYPVPQFKRGKTPAATPKNLTGLRKRLALKNQPPHIREEALLRKSQSPH